MGHLWTSALQPANVLDDLICARQLHHRVGESELAQEAEDPNRVFQARVLGRFQVGQDGPTIGPSVFQGYHRLGVIPILSCMYPCMHVCIYVMKPMWIVGMIESLSLYICMDKWVYV